MKKPKHFELARHGLAWSDLHKPAKVNWKHEAIECALFVVFLACFLGFWIVLPAFLEGLQ